MLTAFYILLYIAEKYVLTTACPDACVCEDNIADCEGLHLISFPKGFDNRTKFLTLKNNSLIRLAEEDFNDLRNLLVLDLSYNHIEALHSDVLRGMDVLETLHLDHNRLDSNVAFTYIRKTIIRLSLSDNRIGRTLWKRRFFYFEALQFLDLSRNNLVYIQSKMFSESLTHLNISRNPIKSIDPVAFANLKNLVYLDLRATNLATFDSGYFAECQSLETLLLGGKLVRSIAADAFVGLEKLRTLVLTNTSVVSVPRVVFSSLVHLKSLYLRANLEWNLKGDVLTPLTELELLKIDKIAVNSSLVFPKLHRLRNLSLTNNRLKVFPINLEALENLEILDISGNSLMALTNNSIFSKSIKALNVSGNCINDIEDDFFGKLGNLQSIDLSNNLLEHLKPVWFESHKSQLQIVTGGNPWTCDCNMKSLKDIYRDSLSFVCARSDTYSLENLNDFSELPSFCFKCTAPMQYKESYFVGLDEYKLGPCSGQRPVTGTTVESNASERSSISPNLPVKTLPTTYFAVAVTFPILFLLSLIVVVVLVVQFWPRRKGKVGSMSQDNGKDAEAEGSESDNTYAVIDDGIFAISGVVRNPNSSRDGALALSSLSTNDHAYEMVSIDLQQASGLNTKASANYELGPPPLPPNPYEEPLRASQPRAQMQISASNVGYLDFCPSA